MVKIGEFAKVITNLKQGYRFFGPPCMAIAVIKILQGSAVTQTVLDLG